MGDVRVEPTQFLSEGEIVRGHFLIPDRQGPFPGVCKFHGLPGSSKQAEGIARELAESGFMVLTFDFRGFRASQGLFSLENEIEDAGNAVNHFLSHREVQGNCVAVYGASFGAVVGVATAASDSRVGALVLRAPIYDTEEMFGPDRVHAIEAFLENIDEGQMHGLDCEVTRRMIIKRLTRQAPLFNPMRLIRQLSPRPLLIVAGDQDRVIDLAGVIRLYETARTPKRLEIVKGANHRLTDVKAAREVNEIIIEWLLANHPCCGQRKR